MGMSNLQGLLTNNSNLLAQNLLGNPLGNQNLALAASATNSNISNILSTLAGGLGNAEAQNLPITSLANSLGLGASPTQIKQEANTPIANMQNPSTKTIINSFAKGQTPFPPME